MYCFRGRTCAQFFSLHAYVIVSKNLGSAHQEFSPCVDHCPWNFPISALVSYCLLQSCFTSYFCDSLLPVYAVFSIVITYIHHLLIAQCAAQQLKTLEYLVLTFLTRSVTSRQMELVLPYRGETYEREKFRKLMIFAEKTFTDWLLVLHQRTPHTQIS